MTTTQGMSELGKKIDAKHVELGDLAMKILAETLNQDKADKVLAILGNVSQNLMDVLDKAIKELEQLEGKVVPPVQVMYVERVLPQFVIEEKRYDEDKDDRYNKPDGWVFMRLIPDEDGWVDPLGEDRGMYREQVDGWMRTPDAEEYRQQLIDSGYTKVDWNEVSSELFRYTANCVVPAEWQNRDDSEAVVLERTWVWIKR